MKVYLAGPISGLTYGQAEHWRDAVRQELAPEITCYSPLRKKREYLRDKGVLTGSYESMALSKARGIMTRDNWDCMTADLILVNLLGAERISVGTVMEIAWAFAYCKPLVVAIEPDGSNVHEHPMITEATGFRVASLAEAVATTRAILLP